MPTSPAIKKHLNKLKINRHILLWSGIVVGVIVIISVILTAVAYTSPGTKIVRGVTVAGQNIGGLDSLTAIHQQETRWAKFQASAFQFQAPGRTMTILVTADTATDSEVVLSAVDFDPTKSVNAALSFGRRGNWWQQVRERTSGWLGRKHEMGTIGVSNAMLEQKLKDKFSDLAKPATDATIKFSGDTPAVVASTDGTTFDYATAVKQVEKLSQTLELNTITLKTTPASPDIATSPELSTLIKSEVPNLLKRAPLTLTLGDKNWSISREQLKKILGFAGTTKNPRLGLDVLETTKYLNTVATDVNVKAQNAKFSIVDGKVQAFQASAIGTTLDVAGTITAMQTELFDKKQSTVALVVTNEQPLTDTVDTNNLGITELVASATTSFRGSPTNRRFNLSYGAQLLNGLLIQPGEEFSLVKALGKIDAEHGWKPELVILGPKITPEFGGGLCQVATTLFRAALNTGLPITERHNHSLRISYYEPPTGLDATIYDPQPDLRFKNDYTNPLLLQTVVDGNNLTFSFYGTKDGRAVEIPEPKVYNRVAIPAAQTIEVDDLKPGETVCQKPGHPGADATATYTVTKLDGTKVTQTFQSHYRAIGVICRVGKKPAPKPKPVTNTNTTTADTNTN